MPSFKVGDLISINKPHFHEIPKDTLAIIHSIGDLSTTISVEVLDLDIDEKFMAPETKLIYLDRTNGITLIRRANHE